MTQEVYTQQRRTHLADGSSHVALAPSDITGNHADPKCSSPANRSRVLAQLAAFEAEAQSLLATHEAATARVIASEQSYQKLSGLSLSQDELFREGRRAIESNVFRAAHVLAWAAFIDYLHNYLLPSHHAELAAVQPKWKLSSPDELRDQADFQVIEAAKNGGVYDKTVMKALHGLLNKRNECAHPSIYFPDLNQTLGYISELSSRIERLK